MSYDVNNYSLQQALTDDRNHVWHHLTQHKPLEHQDPLMIVEGKGMRVLDAQGKEYLDAVSGGVWTVNVGYGRESIANAVRDQLVKLNYFANSAGSLPGAMFAQQLIAKMPGMSRVYYSNSGSEANEKAYKIVRQIAHKKYGGKKHKILYRDRDYHGTTITALSSTGQLQRKDQYGPFTPGFVEFPHCSAYHSPNGGDADFGIQAAQTMEATILREGADTVGAVVIEPITAGGGVIVPPQGYMQEIRRICDKYDILLHIDEVVCGLGRTGKWFGYQHFDIVPDIVTMAKGVASGYAAISCTVTTEAVFNDFKDDASDPMGYFRDISTFGGCTAGPAAALENMRIIEEENLLQNVQLMGAYLQQRLEALADKYKMVGDIRGKGLFQGIELVQDRASREPVDESVAAAVAADCMAQGVIIGRTNRSFERHNNTLCLSPALIASQSEIDEIVNAIDAALAKIA
ncbi:MAG: aminotransferase class III-fold pyridoxal phosphate-dependent enzyme [Gammaproteobacteria bacterium]|jgi:taurine-pyruvate aminotransferase|nr:aminotransferase class III-fold pyridoxal phosphate-dependent enzyme [Gammaproteobacteria bacterium]